MTLRDVLVEAATLAGVAGATDVDGTMSWELAGTVIATLDATGTEAAFRLDPVLAAAARRTPDVAGSPRGDEWVAFRPATVDAHAADRAGAWFAAAVRRATA